VSITTEAAPYGGPYGDLYDPAMAKTELMGVEALRKVLGARLDLAKKDGTHIVATKHGVAEGVLVPMDWYRKAREALKDPTDL
jgi:hypothetical protein